MIRPSIYYCAVILPVKKKVSCHSLHHKDYGQKQKHAKNRMLLAYASIVDSGFGHAHSDMIAHTCSHSMTACGPTSGALYLEFEDSEACLSSGLWLLAAEYIGVGGGGGVVCVLV
jgi:hypothetical protein